MGFTEMLTLLFIALKLLGLVSWSWWVVLLPEILAVIFYLVFFVFYLLAADQIRSTKEEILNKYLRRW